MRGRRRIRRGQAGRRRVRGRLGREDGGRMGAGRGGEPDYNAALAN